MKVGQVYITNKNREMEVLFVNGSGDRARCRFSDGSEADVIVEKCKDYKLVEPKKKYSKTQKRILNSLKEDNTYLVAQVIDGKITTCYSKPRVEKVINTHVSLRESLFTNNIDNSKWIDTCTLTTANCIVEELEKVEVINVGKYSGETTVFKLKA